MTNDILFSLWSQARPSFLSHGLSRDFYIGQIVELELRPGLAQFNPVGFSLVFFWWDSFCSILRFMSNILWNVVFSVRRFPPSGYNFWVSTVL
jgi:hypothetical protein